MKSPGSYRTGFRLHRVGLFFVLALLFSSPSLLAQDPKDPFDTEPIEWERADLPLPYGVVANTDVFMWGDHDTLADPLISFGVDFYYDTWQLGVHREQWGNVIRLMTRTVGRDFVNYGFWVEYGVHTRDVYEPLPNFFGNGPEKRLAGSETMTALGAGYRYGLGYSPHTSLTLAFELSGGTTHGRGALPLGFRIPFESYAIRFEITPQVVGYNAEVSQPSGNSEWAVIYGIWASGSFGLNFER